ncbi:MAG TPA: asparaginase domain-containing protein, partial [Bacteroidales bacterium]|nr:asparaginase domain-containing protein [Bacteroidales bacterium]
MKRKILLIYTGGTIGMVQNAETGALEVFNFKDIYTLLPMLRLIEAHIDFYALLPLIDSADTNPNFWIRLAKLI